MQHHSKIGAGLPESGPPGGVGNAIRIEMAAFYTFGEASVIAERIHYDQASVVEQHPAVRLAMGFNTVRPVYQSKRGVAGCTTSAGAGSNCSTDITVTWTNAFADANYSVFGTGSAPTNSPSAPYVTSATKLAGSVHINYFAITASAASYATIASLFTIRKVNP
jgi:hypothetical protein